ncbi:furin-like repeat-containing protein [Sulfurospirillum halorespirans]|uniref:Uncharacterized protein n=1 Tax=Sulfurospirillum halorespirans DSM 13726 TaxID=1193502 RepID=A0A1D7THW2_9BACT|nr:furin-like repeat-containing protein [Sulfurospirillum halorespirans]AOO64563.1 hypothetical protein SHALO_0781 [Sulfurospirillum halorespirans DSM 13726]
MKKILLALMMISSFLFSGPHVTATYEGNDIYKSEGVCRKIGVWHDWSAGTTGYSAYNFEGGYIVIADFAKNQVHYYLYTYATCPVPAPTCTADQDLVAGVCVPKCPTGSHVDSDLNLCMGDYNQTKTTFDNDNFIVYFSDGAEMYCDVSTEKCITHDKDFNVIPNRFLNPNLNPDGTVKDNGLIPDSLPVSSWLSTAYDAYGKPITNAVGQFFQALGWVIAYESTGDGSFVVSPTGLNSLNPFAVLGSGLFTLGSAMVTPDDVVIATPTNTDNGVTVNVSSNSGVSFDQLSTVASSTPESGTPVFSKNGIYTQRQITEANLKTVWDNAAGVGKMPANALILGSDIIFPTNSPSTALINSPTQVEIVKTSPDNTAQSIVVNKADLANTASSGTDLPYTVKDYKAPVINNDGTVTQATTSTPSSTSPSNGNTTSTNPTTGQTTTTPSSTLSGTATTSDGKSIDLSGVTGRLDSLGKQLEKLNGTAQSGNELLGSINNKSASMANSLNSIQSSATNMNALMSQTSDGLTEQTWTNDIPTDYSVFNTWQTTWNNLKSSVDTVTSKGDELKELVNGDSLTLDLPKGSLEQCPYNGSIDLVFAVIPLSFDFCTVLSPLRPVFYTMFYLFFVFGILFSSLKILMRMA